MLGEKEVIKELENMGYKVPVLNFYENTDSTNTRAREYAANHPDFAKTAPHLLSQIIDPTSPRCVNAIGKGEKKTGASADVNLAEKCEKTAVNSAGESEAEGNGGVVTERREDFDSCDSAEVSCFGSRTRGAIFLAKKQSAGRGRRGRSFLSDEGGIYLSVLFYPDSPISDPAGITAEAAALAAMAIESVLPIKVDVKWVNDLYINGKKIAGILTEGEFDENGKLRYYVVGMGINVYKNPAFCTDLTVATSLEDVLGYAPNINKICASVLELWLHGSYSHAELYKEYCKRSFLLGRRVLVPGTESYEARVLGIEVDYSLSVMRDDGKVFSLNSGEISLKL